MEEPGFTPEEIGERARQNATATMLATLAFLRERGIAGEDFARFTGARVAPTWESVREQGALAVARQAALNLVSAGGALLDLSGDEARAEALIGGWPDPALLAMFDLDEGEADALHHLFGPIAESLGLDYEWQRGADQVRLVFSR